jgi:hypothetical protein
MSVGRAALAAALLIQVKPLVGVGLEPLEEIPYIFDVSCRERSLLRAGIDVRERFRSLTR